MGPTNCSDKKKIAHVEPENLSENELYMYLDIEK